jgi:hypothetical protein
VPELDEAAASLANALPVVGPHLFAVGESNIIRLNLNTGAIKTNAYRGELGLFPSPRGDRVYYVGKNVSEDVASEAGELDPELLTLKPLPFPKDLLAEGDFIGLSRDGRRVAVLSGESGSRKLVIHSTQGGSKTIPLGTGESRFLIRQAEWSPDGTTVYASYSSPAANPTNSGFGVVEIPLDGRPFRQIPLLEVGGRASDETLAYFQMSLSHDGRTIAVASTYLAAMDQVALGPKDCALFLVDLTSPKRPVTRVPLYSPPKE